MSLAFARSLRMGEILGLTWNIVHICFPISTPELFSRNPELIPVSTKYACLRKSFRDELRTLLRGEYQGYDLVQHRPTGIPVKAV